MAGKSSSTKAKETNTKKTALVLSGGGSRGAYQIGAWKALEELGWHFDMVIGVSVGSLNGAMVVQQEQILAESLWRELETDTVFDVGSEAQLADFAVEFLKKGGASTHGLQNFVDKYLDEERVRKSPIDFGLLTVEFPSLKPHYLWKKDIPKGKIGSFVMASSSAFPAIQAYDIDGKKYVDGGFENNMPIHMAVERGATDIVAIYLQAVGRFDMKAEVASAQNANLTLIQPKWDLGNFLIFNKENTAKILRFGYQDTMKAFGVYDGYHYTFIKGAFDKKELKKADAAAKIFDLDPLVLYSKKKFMEDLSTAVKDSSQEFSTLITQGRRALKTRNFDLKRAGEFFLSSNKKVVALLIARDLNDNKESSIFLNRYPLKILRDEISAARFIQKEGMI